MWDNPQRRIGLLGASGRVGLRPKRVQADFTTVAQDDRVSPDDWATFHSHRSSSKRDDHHTGFYSVAQIVDHCAVDKVRNAGVTVAAHNDHVHI